MKGDQLLDLLTTWQDALRVARAIDSSAYQQARGWDLGGWMYQREPWGMSFVRHDRRHTPVESVAVVTTPIDAAELAQAVPVAGLPMRVVDLSGASAPGTSAAREQPSPKRQGAKRPYLRVQLGLLCLGFAALAVATLYTRSRRHDPPPIESEAPQRYFYCPECGLEMTCPPDYPNRAMFCPHCGPKRQLEINSFSHNSADSPRSRANLRVIAVALGVPTALALAVYVTGRVRTGAETAPEGNTRRFACPGCGHKISSTVYAPGSTAICAACGEQFVVPGARGGQKVAGEDASVRQWGEALGSELMKKRNRHDGD